MVISACALLIDKMKTRKTVLNTYPVELHILMTPVSL